MKKPTILLALAFSVHAGALSAQQEGVISQDDQALRQRCRSAVEKICGAAMSSGRDAVRACIRQKMDDMPSECAARIRERERRS